MFESVKEYVLVAAGDPIRNESINRRYRATQWDRVSNDVASASLAIMADIRSTMANIYDDLECE